MDITFTLFRFELFFLDRKTITHSYVLRKSISFSMKTRTHAMSRSQPRHGRNRVPTI